MASQAAKRVLVIAGAGNLSGTGAATARIFAKNGYSIALIGRAGSKGANALAEEINNEGYQAATFPVETYSHDDITTAWSSIRTHYPRPHYAVRAAVFNVGHGVWKPFLDVTPQDVQDSLQTNVAAAFSFSRSAILAFKDNDLESEEKGKRGTLIFTGATAGMRGNVMTSAFAAGKFGMRALSQSLAKEFGKDNIHVAHAIIDGVIQIDPKADVEKVKDTRLKPESIASSYLYLANQDRSTWTWELDPLASQIEHAFTARGTITDTDSQSISNITQACRDSCISFGSSLSACGYDGDDSDDDNDSDNDFDFDFDQDNIDPACACTRTNLANLVTCRDCLVNFLSRLTMRGTLPEFVLGFIQECARYGYNSSGTTNTTGTAIHTGSAIETGSVTDTGSATANTGSSTETGTPTETSPASTATSTSTSTSDATKITGTAAGMGYGVVAMVLTAVSLAVL